MSTTNKNYHGRRFKNESDVQFLNAMEDKIATINEAIGHCASTSERNALRIKLIVTGQRIIRLMIPNDGRWGARCKGMTKMSVGAIIDGVFYSGEDVQAMYADGRATSGEDALDYCASVAQRCGFSLIKFYHDCMVANDDGIPMASFMTGKER